MLGAVSVIGRLLGLNLGSPARGRARSRRRRDDQRWQVPAEISPLEQRCLLSGGAHGGIHPGKTATTSTSGDPVLLNWDGYQWDANYNWSQDSGPYVNGQLWSPKNAAVESDGLHLKLKQRNFSSGAHIASAEVDLVATSSGQPFNPGYGTYLVSAKTPNGESFNDWTKNKAAIFGAFTYENLHGSGYFPSTDPSSISGLPPSVIATLKPGMSVTGTNYAGKQLFDADTSIQSISGGTVELTKPAIQGISPPSPKPPIYHTIYFHDTSLTNSQRELDMIEASRFGAEYHNSNAQFTLQPYNLDPQNNIHRITLNDHGQITLVMKWTAANQPVTFSEYNGTFDLNNLPANPTITWTTSTNQDQYIPNSNLQTFHLNLWQADWTGITPQPTQVIVTNFQYAPAT